MNFAVLASGNGSNLQAIIKAVAAKKIKAKLVAVVSDKADAFCLERGRKAKIASYYINPKDFASREAFDRRVVGQLQEAEVDFVVLAGYMRLLSPYFIKQYEDKILNIHPSLLPAFKGTQAIKDAFDYGVKVTGPTVHFVVDEMDAGAIIMQAPLEITSKDTLETLSAKIHKAEHKIYPQAIDLFARGKLHRDGRRVSIR